MAAMVFRLALPLVGRCRSRLNYNADLSGRGGGGLDGIAPDESNEASKREAHHLAKVRVGGSSPDLRSKDRLVRTLPEGSRESDAVLMLRTINADPTSAV